MRSSTGDELTNWRAWEAPGVYEKRLAAKATGKTRGKGGRRGRRAKQFGQRSGGVEQ